MSQYEFSFKENIIEVTADGSTTTVEFDWPVAEVKSIAGVFVVRLEPEPGSCDNRNVFGVSREGEVLWQVSDRKHVYEDSPYTGVVQAGEQARLLNWDGLELLLDPRTGIVVSEGYGT